MIYSNLIKKKKPHIWSLSGIFFFSPPFNTNYVVRILFKITINMQVVCVGAMPSGQSLHLLVIISLWQRYRSGQEAQSAPWCTSKHLARWNSAHLSPAVRPRLIKKKMNVLLKCTAASARARPCLFAFNICAVAPLCSGPTWRAGAGGARGYGGVRHASGAVRAPPTPRRRRWRRRPGGERACAGVIQQGDCGPSDARTQRHHPYLPAVVRGHYITLGPGLHLNTCDRTGPDFDFYHR